MENKGLIFIPDISGFTKFVNETEIDHSRLIIQELLEILINANITGLEISEIEGDAILFYKFGDAPTLTEIFRQVEKMFCSFHQGLVAYDNRRYCQCTACTSAISLSLKIVTHYGEFTGYQVKNYHKLIGKDLIIAHQLLKNDIQQHEYWLVTSNLSGQTPPQSLANWMHWNTTVKETGSGEVLFHYTQLSDLKKNLEPEESQKIDLDQKTKEISVSHEFDTDIITLFHAAGDFNNRHRWYEGVNKVEEVNHFLPRVGMKCKCVLDNGEYFIYSSSYHYTTDKIEFTETEENSHTTYYFTLEKRGPTRSKLTLEIYLKKDFISNLLYRLARKKNAEIKLKASMIKLEGLVAELNKVRAHLKNSQE
jgi:hypothetical protein